MNNTVIETVMAIIKVNTEYRNYPFSIIYNSVQSIYDTLYMSPLNELECLSEFIENFEPRDEERMLSDDEIESISTWLVSQTLRNKEMGKSPLKTLYFLVDDSDNIPEQIGHKYGVAKVYDEVLILKIYLNTLDDFGLPNNIITNKED